MKSHEWMFVLSIGLLTVGFVGEAIVGTTQSKCEQSKVAEVTVPSLRSATGEPVAAEVPRLPAAVVRLRSEPLDDDELSPRAALAAAAMREVMLVIDELDATDEQRERLRELHHQFTEREHATLTLDAWKALAAERDELERQVLGDALAAEYQQERDWRRARIAAQQIDEVVAAQ